MITSVRVSGEYVIIERGTDRTDWTCLTFAEVKVAAQVLREHLLAAVPPEVPSGRPDMHWHHHPCSGGPGVLEWFPGPPCPGDPGYVKL